MFKALLLHKDTAGFRAGIEQLDDARLAPLTDGGVLVAVEYSTLNYKDGLALTDKGPVVRLWPMVPGIDGAGTVLASRDPRWQPGDRVVHNGWGVGETRWGCLAERVVLAGDGLVRLPAAFSARQAMAIGTAGYTAMLCVLALERHGVRAGGRGPATCWSRAPPAASAVWRWPCWRGSVTAWWPRQARPMRPRT